MQVAIQSAVVYILVCGLVHETSAVGCMSLSQSRHVSLAVSDNPPSDATRNISELIEEAFLDQLFWTMMGVPAIDEGGQPDINAFAGKQIEVKMSAISGQGTLCAHYKLNGETVLISTYDLDPAGVLSFDNLFSSGDCDQDGVVTTTFSVPHDWRRKYIEMCEAVVVPSALRHYLSEYCLWNCTEDSLWFVGPYTAHASRVHVHWQDSDCTFEILLPQAEYSLLPGEIGMVFGTMDRKSVPSAGEPGQYTRLNFLYSAYLGVMCRMFGIPVRVSSGDVVSAEPNESVHVIRWIDEDGEMSSWEPRAWLNQFGRGQGASETLMKGWLSYVEDSLELPNNWNYFIGPSDQTASSGLVFCLEGDFLIEYAVNGGDGSSCSIVNRWDEVLFPDDSADDYHAERQFCRTSAVLCSVFGSHVVSDDRKVR